MKYFSLFFEARGIQSYIFESGKMKEMVGASELVKGLCGSELDAVINHLKLERIIPENKEDSQKIKSMTQNQVFFSRRSGGVFTAIFADKTIRDRFLAIWSLLVTRLAPGLETVHAVSESENFKELVKETYDILGYNRNCPPPVLPEATPMHVLAPRTGKPAVKNQPVAGGEKVWMDEASIKKAKIADVESSNALSDSFLSEANRKIYSFPVNLDEEGDFPFRKDSRYLGLIHADGNGLGQTLIAIRENFSDGAEYAVMLRLFSDKLEAATKEAAKAATEKLIEKCGIESGKLPMRPLVLGGDDLTVLVRADYAMQFTEDYCKAFEESTKRNFKDLHDASPDIPEKLTACAGIAYVKNNQPFMDAFELAESLCSESKKISKDVRKKEERDFIPATVTSQVVTNSFIESYEDYTKKELTIKKDGKEFVATLGAYAFDENEKSIPTLAALRKLCEELSKDGVTASSIRQYATMIFGDANISREKWRRWIEILDKRNLFNGFANCMKAFGVENIKDSPWNNDDKTSLFDALQLLSMEE